MYTEGIIRAYEDIMKIAYCENVKETEKGNVVRVNLNSDVDFDTEKLQRHFYTSSSCGRFAVKSSIEAV